MASWKTVSSLKALSRSGHVSPGIEKIVFVDTVLFSEIKRRNCFANCSFFGQRNSGKKCLRVYICTLVRNCLSLEYREKIRLSDL